MGSHDELRDARVAGCLVRGEFAVEWSSWRNPGVCDLEAWGIEEVEDWDELSEALFQYDERPLVPRRWFRRVRRRGRLTDADRERLERAIEDSAVEALFEAGARVPADDWFDCDRDRYQEARDA